MVTEQEIHERFKQAKRLPFEHEEVAFTVNKFGGRCIVCREYVSPKLGWKFSAEGEWRVVHRPCLKDIL